MKRKCFWNIEKLYYRLIIAGIVVAAFMHPLPVSANGANDGGHVEGAGNSTGSTVTGEVKPGDPLVSAYGDAWEVTLYVQSYKGLYGLLKSLFLIVTAGKTENCTLREICRVQFSVF